ncbi:MAG TPA: helix-turn-helix domain-containing protein, partial [Jatrophihabitantaceae bacterium]
MSSPDAGRDADTPVNMRRLGRLRVIQTLTDTGEVSRADLMQRTGLSRTTISSLIVDLVHEG